MPRKELQAAVLGARLKATILEAHTMTIRRFIFWTDSKTVLSWIQSDHRKYKPFVAHRVSEVLDHSEMSDWRWVPSSMNVADDATRDVHPPRFEINSRWINGPVWLTHEQDWPESLKNAEDTNEERRLTVLTTKVSHHFDFSKYSSYNRMKRVFAWVLRWLSLYKEQKLSNNRTKYGGSVLTAKELIKCEYVLCRISQRESYPEEMSQLEVNGPLNSRSKIFKLTPFIDSEGVLRVNGRVDNSSILPLSSKRPIILDSKHHLTELIISHYHEFLHHINEDTIICEIRKKFWIDNLRQGVRRAKKQCMQCKIESAHPVQQIMGQLPSDRLTPYVRPFTFTGLDYFGPVSITIGRRQEKRWIALFTCLTVRAVHLEIAKDLSADQCILCLRNFINIRGVPSRIRSDNGTNLVGARNELVDAAELFNDDRVRNAMENRGIEWKFICPANPSEGGCWERMVQSVKRVLRKTLKECAPREETLRSFLLEAANIVNSRPLTHLPVDSNDTEPLTPNHFLLGETRAYKDQDHSMRKFGL